MTQNWGGCRLSSDRWVRGWSAAKRVHLRLLKHKAWLVVVDPAVFLRRTRTAVGATSRLRLSDRAHTDPMRVVTLIPLFARTDCALLPLLTRTDCVLVLNTMMKGR